MRVVVAEAAWVVQEPFLDRCRSVVRMVRMDV